MYPDMPHLPEDYETESDLSALTRAQEVEKDPSRMARAKAFAERRKEEFASISASLPGKPPRRFSGEVRNSRMAPK